MIANTIIYTLGQGTGEEARFERYDVLGTISKDKLPDWAKEGLQKIENKRAERRKNDRGER